MAISAFKKRFIELIEANGDTYWEYYPQLPKVYISPQIYRILGYDKDEIFFDMETWAKQFYPGDFEKATNTFVKMLNGEIEQYESEIRIKRKDGSYAYLMDRGNVAERNEDGEITLVSGMHIDITNRKLLEMDLQAKQERYMALMNFSSDALFIMDAETGKLLEHSHQVKEYLGYSDEELANKSLFDWDKNIKPEDYMEFSSSLTSIPQYLERINTRKDGSTYWAGINASKVMLDGEEFIYASTRDISEQKALEQEITKERNFISTIIGSASAIIAVVDLDGTMKLLNDYGQKFTGYTQKEVSSKPYFWHRFLKYSDIRELLKMQDNAKKGDLVENYRNTWIHHSGEERMIEWTNTFLKNSDGSIEGVLTIGIDIEEQYQLEKMFKGTFEQAAVGIAHVSPEGRCIKVNHTLAKMLGYQSEAEVVGLSLSDVTYPDDLEKDMEMGEQLLDGVITQYSLEKRYYSRDGSVFWANLTLSLVNKDDGSADFFIAVIEDVTSRKMVELDIKQNQQLMAQFFEYVPTRVAMFDTNMRYVAASKQFVKDFHSPTDELIGKCHYDFFPDMPQRWKDAHQRSLKGETVSRDMDRYEGPDGEILWSKWITIPWRDKFGKIAGIIVLSEDVTEVKQAGQKLRIATDVIDNAISGIMITNPRNEIVEVNRAFTDITGFNKQEVLGKNPSILQSGMQSEEFYKKLWYDLNSKGHWKGEVRNKRKDGSLYTSLLSISSIFDEDGELLYYSGAFTDISEIQDSQDKLDYLAHHDTLTGLPNRLTFLEELKQALARARRSESLVAVLFFDIDRFKQINDSFGHPKGDRLLQSIAERLKLISREEDLFARLGGDEFVLLVENLDNPESVGFIAQKILETFEEPFLIDELELNVAISIGIAVFPEDGNNSTDLLSNADTAMYKAKTSGGNQYQYYASELTDNVKSKLEMENRLRFAAERGEFYLVYQPQFNLCDGTVTGLEALIRWKNPDIGEVFPLDFIPLAEETGLILKIGEWVINHAFQQVKAWLKMGIPFNRLAINISALQMKHEYLSSLLKDALEYYELSAEYFELEITEGVFMHNLEHTIAELNKLKALGFKLSVDDFGTGYSSFSYLKKLPIHKLKIDKSFVSDIPNDVDDMVITKTIIAMGKSLGLELIAEGVETEAQAEFLREYECCECQGYLFSKPLIMEDCEQYLLDKKKS